MARPRRQDAPLDIRAAARAWLDEDPDPDTRAELQALMDAGDAGALAERFGGRLAFGTAGIRGPLGAGPARMNRAVVRRVTAGLATRLLQDHSTGGLVVVGRDARHKSDVFANETAAVLAGAGFDVRAFPEPVPTPVLAYAARRLEAVAGVQITASHNPPQDNGYKVYWSGGGQIIPPVDAEISAAIDAIGSVTDVPLGAASATDWSWGDLVDDYAAYCLSLQRHPDERDVAVVYTPLHGVAGTLARELLERAGFGVTIVGEQFAPDPDFPTVAFPNPEEPGALDRALTIAAERQADVVLANDPDGDRIAAAIPEPRGWRILSGDEVGCLLADYLLAEEPGGTERLVATTVVSSQLLARIAAARGAAYAETLTGFKWLARAAEDAAGAGRRLLLAYEQALGVMVGDTVRDKDGLSAAVVFADLVGHLRGGGRTVADALDDLARRHGVHATTGRSLRLKGPDAEALVERVLSGLRDQPPADVGGVAVVALADHRAGERLLLGGATEPLHTPPTPLVGLQLADGSRLQVRPSGTEPLLKFYVEVVEPVAGGDVAAARTRAGDRLERLADAFVSWAPDSGRLLEDGGDQLGR